MAEREYFRPMVDQLMKDCGVDTEALKRDFGEITLEEAEKKLRGAIQNSDPEYVGNFLKALEAALIAWRESCVFYGVEREGHMILLETILQYPTSDQPTIYEQYNAVFGDMEV